MPTVHGLICLQGFRFSSRTPLVALYDEVFSNDIGAKGAFMGSVVLIQTSQHIA